MLNPLSQFDQSSARVIGLAIVTLVAVIAAGFVTGREASRVRSAIEPQLMYPNLDTDEATSLIVRSSSGQVLITRNEDDDWVVPARGGYPVRPGPLLQTIGGLAEMELLEAKTARDDWHHFLGLDTPDAGGAGAGVEIVLSNAAGETLAAVIVGNQPESSVIEVDGRERIHVRRADEAQTWLARGSLSLQIDVTQWLATQLYNIDQTRIREARVSPASGDSYTLSRTDQRSENFELIDLPVGREIINNFIVNAVGTALSEMNVEDVRLEADVDFMGGSEIIYRTFDGLEVTLRLANIDGTDAGWVTIFARFTGLPNAEASEAAAVAEEAANVNVLTDGWAFRLPDYKIRQMTLALNDLLRPPPGQETSANGSSTPN